MQPSQINAKLLPPNIERDAPFAFGWFSRPEGRLTLLSMGNAEHEIKPSTIGGEKTTLREFIRLEKDNKQITRMIIVDNKTIGAVWLELFENHGIKAPSVHIMIGDPDYRSRSIGGLAIKAMVDYAVKELGATTIYSRHLASNGAIANLNRKLGFKKDGAEYDDDNGLRWQNEKLMI